MRAIIFLALVMVASLRPRFLGSGGARHGSLSDGTRGSGPGDDRAHLVYFHKLSSSLAEFSHMPISTENENSTLEKSDVGIVLAIRAAVLTGGFYFSSSSNQGCLGRVNG